MILKDIDIEEFKNTVYPEYLKLFPKSERKSLELIQKTYNQGIAKIIEIIEEKEFVGFLIINTLKNSPFAILDYFAILSKYQDKGYGSKALELLKEQYKEEKGIFIEVEKPGLGEDDKENEIREKRAKFYERIGFNKLGFDLDLFKVIYSAYLLPCSNKEFSDQEVIEEIFKIYNTIVGEERIKNNCKIIF